MSARATSWAWQQNVGGNPKLVLLALADHADREDNSCFPKRKTLAGECGISVASVTRALTALEEVGLIERDGRFRENGSRTSNNYLLRLTPASNCADPPPQSEPTPGSDCTTHNLPDEPKDTPPSPSEEEDDPIVAVFHHWQKVMNHPVAQLDDSRRRTIARALANATLEECLQAITGCSKSDYHMARGEYKGGTRYDHLSLVLRNREFIERFIAMAPLFAGADVDGSSALAVKIREAKRNVLVAFQLAGSDEAQRKGDESERFLVDQGIQVVRGVDGRPTFVD